MDLGIKEAADRIQIRLRRYIEAQYNIRDEGLLKERQILLEEPGCIAQNPYLEVTPSYAMAEGGFEALEGVPDVVTKLLSELSNWSPGVGVFPPYAHQAQALEGYFQEPGADLVVATGTGSGKTETFLYNILGKLASEAATSPESFKLRGVRALLLYPMNALVSDQTSRLRRFLGDERLAAMFLERWKRIPQFGMYTSRTPYPGRRNGTKDKRHLGSVLDYYLKLQGSADKKQQDLVRNLKDRGRWPAKDLEGFYAEHLQAPDVYGGQGPRAGRQFTRRNWDQRLLTQPGDRELLTRHEMQLSAPDLLITNYSMLEYMLLRPIERSIFEQTAAWLKANDKNQLLLVLDEAHMYRGVAGAEVGFLIRRLMSRLKFHGDAIRKGELIGLDRTSLGQGDAGSVRLLDQDMLLREFLAFGRVTARATRDDHTDLRPSLLLGDLLDRSH